MDSSAATEIRDTFNASATIKNVEQLEHAARVVLHYESQLQAIAREESELIAAVRQQLSSRLDSQVQGVTINERLDTLRDSISRFVREKSDTVFADGTRTREFTDTIVRMRDCPPRLLYEAPRQSIVKKLTKNTGISDAISRLLKRIKLHHFIKLKIELDPTAIKKAFAAGKIKPAKLKSLGLTIEQQTTVNIEARS